MVETGANVAGLNIRDRCPTQYDDRLPQVATVPADKLVAIPEGISFDGRCCFRVVQLCLCMSTYQLKQETSA